MSSSLFINCGGSRAKIEKDTYVEDLNGRGPSTFSSVSDSWGYSSSGVWVGKANATFLATDRFNLINESVPEYYKTARLSPQSLKYYGLCMRRGSYKVQLHFAEIMFSNDQTYNSLGRRVFDIYVQGNLLERDFNIAERAGGVGKPFTRQIDALQVNGSTLEIHLQWSGYLGGKEEDENELVDMDLGTNFSKKEAKRMLEIALLCTNPSPTLRPPMSSVVSMLEGKSKVQPPLGKDVNLKQEEDEERSSSSSRKLLDDLTEVKIE
ncbi:unnamed protein product [Thlaspi arvense]|uniref:non-specific serine/threonine protein kinase n=1 Tax=Thlaspi arvense TaxID=13288 RepID=A0AAU9REC0_THLAR|nr:unnamed protein product [Thlaspi arvense]